MDRLKAGTLASGLYLSRWQPLVRTVTFAAPSETLTDFPALVKADSTFNIANGYDVHFQTMAGVELPFELDFYDSVTGNGAWWVKIPSMPSGSSTPIKMIYGDESITSNQSSPTTVWSGYLAVYHFNELNPSQQFNSAKGIYGTWSEDPAKNKTVSFVSGGVTGRMMNVNAAFGWGSPSKLSCSCPSTSSDPVHFMTVSNASDQFNGGTFGWLAQFAPTTLYTGGFTTYGGGYTRQTPYTPGTLDYMSASWRSSDQQALWQINDTLETGSFPCNWPQSPSTIECLYCYCSNSSTFEGSYQVDEIRIGSRYATQAETSYENNILMHHNQYVTYSSERKGN